MKINQIIVQKLVLKFLWNHSFLLNYAQKFRYLLMRGPLQNRLVQYYQKRSKTKSIAVLEPSLFPDLNVDKAVAELNEKGYSIAFQLSKEYVEELVKYRDLIGSNNIHHPHKSCVVINRIACDSNVIAVVRRYIGAEPILYGSRLYFTKPKAGIREKPIKKYENSKNVHFDVTDFKDLELFIYLTDIDKDTTPHVVVEGTHKHKTLWDLMVGRYNQKAAEKRFGGRFKMLTGKAGMAFFEDTSTFHIQSISRKGRLMVSICYTLQRSPELARYIE